MKWRERASNLDWHLPVLALCLSLVGVAFIWSSTRDSLSLSNKYLHQLLFIGVSVPAVAVVLRFGYIKIRKLSYLIYTGLLFLLVFLHLFGGGGQKANRWFDIGLGFGLQPSEFMKIGLILVLARYMMYRKEWNRWSAFLAPFALTLAPMMLICMQPDLGTALLFPPMLFGMLFMAGAGGKRLLLLIGLGVALAPCVYYSPILKEYQRERVTSFLQQIPSLEASAKALIQEGKIKEARELERKIRALKSGTGYQQYFSQVSIGSGGLAGEGLSEGPQNRLNYLPERHTDFIFAIIGEEWGFLGCSAILVLFLLLVALVLGIARRTREPFGRLVCCGVGVLLGFQVFVNTAITVGLLPIAGMPLPFISYGGSSLITSFLALALVLDVGYRRVRVFAS